MKISTAIDTLKSIQAKFGDISITGDMMSSNISLKNIIVTDESGSEVWPRDPNGVVGKNKIDGVFFD